MQQQAGRAEDHDDDLGRLHDAHDLRLVERVRELPGEGRQEEEGQDEEPARNGAERGLLLRIAVDAVDHQQHHRGAKEVVVERAEELRDENRPEAPRAEKVEGVLHQLVVSRLASSAYPSSPAVAGPPLGARRSPALCEARRRPLGCNADIAGPRGDPNRGRRGAHFPRCTR